MTVAVFKVRASVLECASPLALCVSCFAVDEWRRLALQTLAELPIPLS